jgi:hypothetical protein
MIPPSVFSNVVLYSTLANTAWIGCYAIDINNADSFAAFDSK